MSDPIAFHMLQDPITGGVSPSLGATGDAGIGVMITEPTPLAYRGRDGDSQIELGESGIANALRAGNGGSSRSQMIAIPVAVAENQRGEVVTADVNPALSAGGGKPGMGYAATFDGVAVRRLMPIECERLQGWPDHHTLIDDEGRTIPDSHRYRMIGNGVSSPVAEWVGRCIAAIDESFEAPVQ